jgi:phosphoglycerol transferase MdoB-like AlkP superfamily enzyme
VDFKNKYETNYNAKNIYNDYINPNTSMYVSGLYEYGLRAMYKYFYNLITIDREALKEEIDVYNSLYNHPIENNDYTGIFKDKNVIYVLMESVDSWVIDDDTMPTLNRLKNTGINFTNRYSPFFNGGQTINSEFSMNSGLYAITDYDTIFDIDTVDYKYSLANTLKNNGYSVNSFHANTGKFYNRRAFHELLGYQNHYSAVDLQKEKKLNKNTNYFVDSNFINDDYLSNLVIPKDKKFLSFITTYSGHLDYNKFNKVFKEVEGNITNKYEYEEEYIYRSLVKDTDEFLNILIDKLDKEGVLDNTVLVLVADHYVYGYSDSLYVANKKNVSNDSKLLQNTPCIIWSKDIEHKNINTIMDTADILPTLLNMLGINYNPMNYIGDDVFSEYHDNFVWFSDGTIISNNSNMSEKEMLAKANLNIIKNRNILLTNYYGR